MLEGKFKCVESHDRRFMTKDKIYEFTNGRCIYNNGTESSEYANIEGFKYWNDTTMKIKPYDQPKTLSNSDLWKLVEDGKIPDGSLFQLQENCGDNNSIAKFLNDEGEFRWAENDSEVSFNREDEWIQLPSKPRLSKEQAEIEFGIEIID